VPCAPHATIASAADCANVDAALLPGILKTAQMGYDGKGQVTVRTAAELQAAHAQLGGVRCLLEKKLPLASEVSVIVARGVDGACVHLPVQENLHRNGVLAVTVVPAVKLPVLSVSAAYAAAKNIANSLNYVGVLCVEFFVLEDGSLVANEMAPRPHNSGHYSIEACDVSQFELQVRTLAGLPLLQPTLREPAVMLNILGDCWFSAGEKRDPNWQAVLEVRGAALHLYGKTEAKIGRKMGHITVTAPTAALARARALECCAALYIEPF
jgi:5-(carboxyamino)imidazole ribonucleotide synthase